MRNHMPTGSDPAFAQLFDALARSVHRGDVPAPALTPRQRELAARVAEGLDNRRIAAHMAISEKTVRNALSAMYAILRVEGRPQAIVRMRELGYGTR